MNYTIDLIAGARPNFIKIAALTNAYNKIKPKTFKFRLIHTGQHYDHSMSGSFFEELNIPHPDFNLEVGSGTQSFQTAEIMKKYEALLMQAPSDFCIVVGDVTSTMACAIVAKKMNIKVAHIEGGIRSNDHTMPEEINRLVTDSISDLFFTTSETANSNLLSAGIEKAKIFFVGNTMVDTLLTNKSRFQKPAIFDSYQLIDKKYFILTLHRPANVDNVENLDKLLNQINNTVENHSVLFPIHPRTQAVLQKINKEYPKIKITSPLSYLQFNYLVERSMGVITDSGGITEETTMLGIPCITLRANTERPETCTIGTNLLVGTDPIAITNPLKEIINGKWKKGNIPLFWDGNTGDRIINIFENLFLNNIKNG